MKKRVEGELRKEGDNEGGDFYLLLLNITTILLFIAFPLTMQLYFFNWRKPKTYKAIMRYIKHCHIINNCFLFSELNFFHGLTFNSSIALILVFFCFISFFCVIDFFMFITYILL